MTVMVYIMGFFFVAVSVLKLLDWGGFVHAYSMYDIVAKRSHVYAYLYPLIELGLGIGYLFFWNIPVLATITVILMAVGVIGVTQNLRSDNPTQCACLGTLIKIPLTKFTLFEDIVMGLMAIFMLLF